MICLVLAYVQITGAKHEILIPCETWQGSYRGEGDQAYLQGAQPWCKPCSSFRAAGCDSTEVCLRQGEGADAFAVWHLNCNFSFQFVVVESFYICK